MPQNQPVRIYYLAAGNLGVPILGALAGSGRILLTGVGSQPDKPAGRKSKLKPTPVAAAAEAMGRGIDKLSSVNTPEFHERLQALKVEMLVVASFGQLLKESTLRVPEYGCFNIHASLLPRHRGASPIQAAILSGDAETGVSFMNMEKGLDTGGVYKAVSLPVCPQDDGESLERKLGDLAAAHVVDTIWEVARNGLSWVAQDDSSSTYARKIKKEDGFISWGRDADSIWRMVRAYNPWPRAAALLPSPGGAMKRIQITEAVPEDSPLQKQAPGTVLEQGRGGLLVACGRGALRILKLIPEGRQEMPVQAFLNGNKLATGTVLPDYAASSLES